MREVEFDEAFKRYDGCGQYAIQVEKSGRTLADAIRDYAQLENEFRKDPIGGAMAMNRLPGQNGYRHPVTSTERARAAAKHVGGAPSTSTRPPPSESAGSTYDDVRAVVARQKGN